MIIPRDDVGSFLMIGSKIRAMDCSGHLFVIQDLPSELLAALHLAHHALLGF